MDGLPQTTREILTACYLEEKKYKEVAEERNISKETVKKHIVRAPFLCFGKFNLPIYINGTS